MRSLLVRVAILLLLVSAVTANIKKEVKRAHRRYRSKHGVPNLKWSSELAQHAQDRCDHLRDTDSVASKAGDPYGENLEKLWGSSSVGMGEKAVVTWYEEEAGYDYSDPENSATGRLHFTQIVWKNTEKFGCAFTKKGFSTWVCCSYDPPGNRAGEFENNVPDWRD